MTHFITVKSILIWDLKQCEELSEYLCQFMQLYQFYNIGEYQFINGFVVTLQFGRDYDSVPKYTFIYINTSYFILYIFKFELIKNI